ncbi:hypothetical protein D3C81_753810 [compost metagenome]
MPRSRNDEALPPSRLPDQYGATSFATSHLSSAKGCVSTVTPFTPGNAASCSRRRAGPTLSARKPRTRSVWAFSLALSSEHGTAAIALVTSAMENTAGRAGAGASGGGAGGMVDGVVDGVVGASARVSAGGAAGWRCACQA